MKYTYMDDTHFIDVTDFGDMVPATITAVIDHDQMTNRESVEIKSVVAHFPGEKPGDFSDVKVMHLLTAGTIEIFKQIVSDKFWAAFNEPGDAA